MNTLTRHQHLTIECHALRIKIEKLSAWMQLYRDHKLHPEATRQVLEVMMLINESRREFQQLLITIQNPNTNG